MWCLVDHVWHIQKSIFKDNPQCRISQQPWISMCNESFIKKPNTDRKASLRKLTILRCDKPLCFKLALTLGIWSLLLLAVTVKGSLANTKAGILHGFSWLFLFKTTFLTRWSSLKQIKPGLPYVYVLCKWFVRIWPDFTAGRLLWFLSRANTYWNTKLWHHHADWNTQVNTWLNLTTRLKPNTCLWTLLSSNYTLTLRAQQFSSTAHLLTINSQFTCTVIPYLK